MKNTNSRNKKNYKNVFMYIGLFVLVAIWFVPDANHLPGVY